MHIGLSQETRVQYLENKNIPIKFILDSSTKKYIDIKSILDSDITPTFRFWQQKRTVKMLYDEEINIYFPTYETVLNTEFYWTRTE